MKVILKNLFSLGFVQGINLLIPLLITPFLIKIVGVSLFGVISTAQAVVVFFVLLTDFGFNITSVRRLAQSQGNRKEIEAVINGVFFLKLLLLCFAFIVFTILILLVPQFHKHFYIYLCSFSIVIGQVFLPIWFYQGLEKVNKTIVPVVVFKLLTVGLLFYFIRSEDDAPYVNLIFGIGNILTGAMLFFFIQREYRLSIKLFSRQVLKNEFRGSFAIFIGNVAVVIYSNSALLILSFFLTPYTLGIYSIIDKIMQMIRALLGLIHQVTYPRFCNIVQNAEDRLYSFIKKVYGPVWLGIFLLCLFLYFKPAILVSYFIKDEPSLLFAVEILRYFSFILFVNSLNMPFYQTLLAYKKDWVTVKILLASSICSIFLNLILVPIFSIEGTIITIYFIEMMVDILLISSVLKFKRINEKRNLLK